MSTHFGPMGGGLDTDMETGAPTEPALLSRQSREEERRTRAMDRYMALVNDLAGPGGAVLRQIADMLLKRIDVLVADDKEAAAYLTILRETQRSLSVGERIVHQDLLVIFEREGL